ncbi:hypothetical protein DE146DRAFT_601510 [Phaeosphaeria sp. MPI-PUGE-AT-0046c]|nr:hypothetical protein DE146DRAFT_601510 [Phaeosphaeria sp. MPI-PUGE-AT-0046c]
MSDETFDLTIIGAGIHGLVTLRTYLDVHPNASVVVLDKSSSIGGVWAKDRLYPGLRTNNHFRTHFSEFPMNTEGFDLADDHIPGEHVNRYLEEYVKTFDLEKYIRFNCNVASAVDEGSKGWIVAVKQESAASQSSYAIKTAKLIVATGLTSEPFLPVMDGKDHFQRPIYHISELAKNENGLGSFKKVVLLSGAKFSWDIACAYAVRGVQVDWVIRESGHGPCWMVPNRLTPLKIIPEFLLQTRLITWLSPCIWAHGFPWIRSFFNQHWLGRKIVDAFHAKVQHSAEEINGYDRHPETMKLKPWDDIFFVGTNRGLLNYGLDFFEFVRNGQIRVHVADIVRLSEGVVHLSNDSTVNADVLICGTGWKDTPQLDFVTEKELGLPGHVAPSFMEYIPKADSEILQRFPKLQQQPKPRLTKAMTTDKRTVTQEPYRLYRFMVPPAFIGSRTLAFTGAYRSPATTFLAQAQALWITAFFDDQLHCLVDLDNAATERIMYETVLHTQFGKWRYSRGFGARFPDMFFDSLPYLDLMLKDIGIKNQRKKSWWAERFTPYMPVDYIGIVEEYKMLKKAKT